jgi:hypothetical protein
MESQPLKSSLPIAEHQPPTAQKTAKPPANGSGTSYSRFTIHYLLVQLIGSDRSAFAASRHKVAGQSKTKESSECSIHDEGLQEHPIKS